MRKVVVSIVAKWLFQRPSISFNQGINDVIECTPYAIKEFNIFVDQHAGKSSKSWTMHGIRNANNSTNLQCRAPKTQNIHPVFNEIGHQLIKHSNDASIYKNDKL